jgi:hypothetical protein
MGDGTKPRPRCIIRQHARLERNTEENRGSLYYEHLYKNNGTLVLLQNLINLRLETYHFYCLA